jgi:primosomal replication protein N
MAQLYLSDEGPLRSAKVRRPPGMSGRQWKKLRKAIGVSTKSKGFLRKKKPEEITNPADAAAAKIGMTEGVPQE